MNEWKFVKTGKTPKLKNPVVIAGLPGIGNVGKVAVDFIIDELNASKIYDAESNSMPHSVFVNEDSLIELPRISIYHKSLLKQDVLFVAGDAQPIDERSCYDFSEGVIDLLKSFKGKEVITLGGIGLHSVPEKPRVYCTGTSKKIVSEYAKDTGTHSKLYGVVGPIIGVSGVLLGMAMRKKIYGVAFLAETHGHPMHLGIKGAREIVCVLNKRFSLKMNIKELDEEIEKLELEEEERKSKVIDIHKSKRGMTKKGKDAAYIG